jgi:3-oxoacyl-[acyl-carrier-protein] synthase III
MSNVIVGIGTYLPERVVTNDDLEAMGRDGDWLVMPAVGAGMAWGAVTYQWYDYKKAGTPSP